jgi:phospholipid/cholesterol/gamma-HCH transport system substrate-binding protein
MKKKSANSIKLGVFVTVSLVLLIAGIYYIGQKQRLFSDVFRISGVFNNVNGLQVGNNIRFSGINVGTVENITIISDTSVRVDMIIDEDVQKFIKKDATAIIGSEGLMGNKTINIAPGSLSEKEIDDQDLIKTTKPVDFDEILGQLNTTTQNAALITDDLSAIMSSIRAGKGTVGKLFMDTTLAKDLNQTIKNLRGGTKGFEENKDAVQHSILLRGAFKKKKSEEKEKQEEKKEQEKNK